MMEVLFMGLLAVVAVVVPSEFTNHDDDGKQRATEGKERV